jgi:DNA invertase Pin-like site-specific DNA recombinase
VFAEFERSMIRERTIAGLARAREKGTKSGKPIGRPEVKPAIREAICTAYAKRGGGLRPIAKQFGVAVMTVRKCLAGAYRGEPTGSGFGFLGQRVPGLG